MAQIQTTLPWPELQFWKSSDWAEAQRKLDLLEWYHVRYVPTRNHMFNSLGSFSINDTSVVLVVGQPYVEARFATGRAFSTPSTVDEEDLPKEIKHLFREYRTDLRHEVRRDGDLGGWETQGVLLWNAVPIAVKDKPLLTHWDEWISLTKEVVERTSEAGAVCVFFGGRACRFSQYAKGPAIECGEVTSQSFVGSRIFSRVNAELVRLKKDPIDWRL